MPGCGPSQATVAGVVREALSPEPLLPRRLKVRGILSLYG
jgi:hypothetical protein